MTGPGQRAVVSVNVDTDTDVDLSSCTAATPRWLQQVSRCRPPSSASATSGRRSDDSGIARTSTGASCRSAAPSPTRRRRPAPSPASSSGSGCASAPAPRCGSTAPPDEVDEVVVVGGVDDPGRSFDAGHRPRSLTAARQPFVTVAGHGHDPDRRLHRDQRRLRRRQRPSLTVTNGTVFIGPGPAFLDDGIRQPERQGPADHRRQRHAQRHRRQPHARRPRARSAWSASPASPSPAPRVKGTEGGTATAAGELTFGVAGLSLTGSFGVGYDHATGELTFTLGTDVPPPTWCEARVDATTGGRRAHLGDPATTTAPTTRSW